MKPVLESIMICVFLLIVPFCAHPQSSYLIFKLTNSVPGSTQKLREFTFNKNGNPVTIGTYGSYGNGVSFQTGIGKMLNPTFGFEITGEFAYGRWHKTDVEESDLDYELKGRLQEKVNTVLIKPVVVIRNSGDLLSFYTKLGIIIAPYIRKYEKAELTNLEHVTNTTMQLQYSSVETAKLKIGFTASFGVSFRVSEAVSLFGEISGQIMSLPIQKGHYTKFLLNGIDNLPALRKSDKEWQYQESYLPDASLNPDSPEIRLYNPANYTAIGLSFGMLFHL